MPCPRKVYKHAGSLTVVMPPHVAEHLNIVDGDYMDWDIHVPNHAIGSRWIPPVPKETFAPPISLQEEDPPK